MDVDAANGGGMDEGLVEFGVSSLSIEGWLLALGRLSVG